MLNVVESAYQVITAGGQPLIPGWLKDSRVHAHTGGFMAGEIAATIAKIFTNVAQDVDELQTFA